MDFFNQRIETLSRHKLRALQNQRLRFQIENVCRKVPFYQKLFAKNGIRPSDICTVQDLNKIPFTKKTALRDNYPFGLMAVPNKKLIRLHCSSGTTGKPIVVGYTKKDIEIFSEVVARSLFAAGCRPGMKLQNGYGYGLFTGGLGLHYGAERLNMTVVPISGGNTEKQLMLLKDFQSEAICCTPSYALTLSEALKSQNFGIEDLKLKYAILGAEPWTESVRAEVAQKLNVLATNIYGLSEIIGPGVAQEDVDERGTGSYVWEDHFYPEIVDKDSGTPLANGQLGVLVLTTLTKEAMPLLRYWTNDITSIYYDQNGKRKFIKMGPIVGRADDMLIIRGVNLFHTQVESMLEKIPEFSTNYQLVVTRERKLDEIELKIEIDSELFIKLNKENKAASLFEVEKVKAMKQSLQKKLKYNIGLSFVVTPMLPGTIPRSEGGKLNRILDLRLK
jgi:phenylacetate-CoA ligase